MNADPLYLALEIDQFPAQAIAAYRPCHRVRPFVVVRQHADSHKSAVWACSRLAREMGVRPGMPVQALAKRSAKPDILFPEPDLERTALEDLSRLLSGYTPEYELDGRGACTLDLSGTPILRRMEAARVAEALKEEIRYRVGLEEVSAGASRSRLIARLMARAARPEGVRVCEPGTEGRVLAALDPRLLPGLSALCRDRLRKYGLKTVGQIGRLGLEALVRRFGGEGEKLYGLAVGMDPGEAAPRSGEFQAETVLERDIVDRDMLIERVRYTLDRLCQRLKASGVRAKRLTFVLRYTDHRAVRKTAAPASPTDDYAELSRVALRLYEDLDRRRAAVRSIRLVANGLCQDSGQLDLFETGRERGRRRMERAVAEVRGRMGFESVLRASYLKGRDL